MSKVSSKLAASVRKVKAQETAPAATPAVERKVEGAGTGRKPKPAPKTVQTTRVWPD